MRILSTVATGIGGKLGNVVGTMNKSGMCLREWVVPSNPKSARQTAVRATLTALAGAWSETLTSDQRLGWAVYAATLSFTSKLGTAYTISGFDAYVMCNGARMVASLSRVDVPPAIGGFASYTPPTLAFNATANTVGVTFTNTDDWAGEVGGAMIGRISPVGFAKGITFYEGPFQYLNKIAGAVSPPSSPATWTVSAPDIVVGTQYAVALRVVRADGRVSAEAIFRGLGV